MVWICGGIWILSVKCKVGWTSQPWQLLVSFPEKSTMAPIEALATGLILHQKAALGQATQLAKFQELKFTLACIKNSKLRSDSTQIFPATRHDSMWFVLFVDGTHEIAKTCLVVVKCASEGLHRASWWVEAETFVRLIGTPDVFSVKTYETKSKITNLCSRHVFSTVSFWDWEFWPLSSHLGLSHQACPQSSNMMNSAGLKRTSRPAAKMGLPPEECHHEK